MAKTRRQANRIIDAVIEYSQRLMDGGAWKPEAGRRGRPDPAGSRTRPRARARASVPAAQWG